MKKLIVLLFLMFLLALHISYAEELDVLELHGADLQINLDDVQASAEWADDNILVDAAEYDITLGELEYADSNEVVPNIVAQNEYGEIAIDQEHFPDANFREYIVANIDTDGNGYLSETEREEVTDLDISIHRITDLTGLSYFTELKVLDCYCNMLTELDVSNNPNLEKISCSDNMLTELDVSNNPNLKELSCCDNKLTELDVSNNTNLEKLYCEENRIVELDVSKNLHLKSLTCWDNFLSLLDVSGCSKLDYLDCHNNKLKMLDVSMCILMDQLECYNNVLQSLSLNHNLTYLDCSDNVLLNLDVSSNINLIWISCINNRITSLVFKDCPDLMYIFCADNKLKSLSIGKCPKLERLFCNNNRLGSLDVSKCTALDMLKCNDNKLKKLTLGKAPISDLYCNANKLKTVNIGGCPYLKGEVTCIISGINERLGTVHWGSIFDDYEGRKIGNGYIEIDKSTTLKSGKTILYKPGSPKSIKFTRSSGTLKKGKFINLGKYIEMSPTGIASVCKLGSSNKKVVRVDNSGYAYGLKKGTATITVKTANGKKAKIKIKVK